jgi:hypothetical protein
LRPTSPEQLAADELPYGLTDLFVVYGPPDTIGSDNASELAAKVVQQGLAGSREDALHRSSQPRAKRLQHELQLQALR